MTAKSVLEKHLRIEMPDGTLWAVPIILIAKNRAAEYADEFGGDVERSLNEDTLPIFECSDYQIKDWAANNMNWSDVAAHAFQVNKTAPKTDFQEGWVNGEKEIID